MQDIYLDNPFLKEHCKTIKKGDYLFEQGELAQSLIVILKGRVSLYGEQDGAEHLVSMVETGQFLGEKILVSRTPYQRVLSAKADLETEILELELADIETLEKEHPRVAIDLMKRILLVVGRRFDQANYLVRALRSSDPNEKLTRLVLYFCRCAGQKTSKGTEVVLSLESFMNYVDLPGGTIMTFIDRLQQESLIHWQVDDTFLVPNEAKLLQFLDSLPKMKAA